MNSIVIRIAVHRDDHGLDQLVMALESPPLGDGEFRNFECTPADPAFAIPHQANSDSVKQAGDRLYNGLHSHPEICEALTEAARALEGDRRPLMVLFSAGTDVEGIPWETICSPDGTFLGLDRRWSVARLVSSRIKQTGPRHFLPPLRIAALLSCFNISAGQEWDAIATAVQQSPVPVELLVFVGEPALENQIRAQAQPNVKVHGLPGPAQIGDLNREITGFRPHVIHFFCHGSTDQGAHLELATPVDWLRGSPDSSLYLDAETIASFSGPIERPWLAVLNCCESAASYDNIHSIARDLVFNAGFPATVGMREPILDTVATSFTASFYSALLAAVEPHSNGGAGPLDWSSLLVDPRRALVFLHGGLFKASAARRRDWTLPVLYLQPEEFVLAPSPAAAPGLELLLEILRQMRSFAGTEAPPGYLAELETKITELEGPPTPERPPGGS